MPEERISAADEQKALSGKRSTALLALIIIISAFAYPNLFDVGIMEARNLISAREIIASGNWLIPTLNGEPRIAKPPLPTWIAAIPMLITGTDDSMTANLIPSGLAAALMAIFVFRLGYALTKSRKIAEVSMLVVATSYIFLYMARQNIWDVYAHSFMTCAVFYLYKGLKNSESQPGPFMLVALFVTLSFLSKGPIAIFAMLLPFLIGFAFAFGMRSFIQHARYIALAVVIAGLLSSVWPILVYFNFPDTAGSVFRAETTAWTNKHTNPFWFYITQFPNLVGLWLPFLVFGLFYPGLRRRVEFKSEYTLALIWFLSTILLLSLFPEKKYRYGFPAAVSAGLFVAMVYHQVMGSAGWAGRVLRTIFSIELVLLVLGASIALIFFSGLTAFSIIMAVILIGFGFSIIHDLVKKQYGNTHYKAALGLLLILIIAGSVSQKLGPTLEYENFLKVRQFSEFNNKEFYSLKSFGPKKIWALGRKVKFHTEENFPDIPKGKTIALITGDEGIPNIGRSNEVITLISHRKKTYNFYLVTF